MEKLISTDCLMKKFKIKRPHLGFNGALEVGIMNIIPFHFIHDIQTINPFVFNLNWCLVPQNGINMLWDFLFTLKRRADFIKDIFLNVLGVLKPVQIMPFIKELYFLLSLIGMSNSTTRSSKVLTKFWPRKRSEIWRIPFSSQTG